MSIRTRLGTWVGVCAVLLAGLLGGFFGQWVGWESALAGWLVALALVMVQQHYRRLLNELRDQVATLRDASALAARRPVPEELAAVYAELEALGLMYRHALAERARQEELLDVLRRDPAHTEAARHSLLGRPDAERGGTLLPDRAGGDGRNMVGRLAPNFHWIAATPALQQFLGVGIGELVARSFLDFVHPDDVPVLAQALREALEVGEGHNITFRLLPRAGGERHVQLDVLTRYTDESRPLHLRCHFADVTRRVLTERDLLLRTRQLSEANEQLRRSNRDLETLKESYRDLYHRAPVMYFSLDAEGRFAAWNQTLILTLGYAREDLLGQPYTRLLAPSAGGGDGAGILSVYREAGEIETQWVKKDGTVIDVWVRNVPVVDEEGQFLRTRSAALDVTERNRLANALRDQHEEAQRANAQLRRINHELDDFTHVVSHDLKEPLRTLQAFSNFLALDYTDRLGEEGKEYINHLIQASKRLGTLIDDLLTLSRAGRIIHMVKSFDLAETVQTVCRDLADLIQRKGARVRIEGPLPAVTGDPERLSQLLANLITNGLKYNHSPEPEVVIGQAEGHAPSGNGKPAGPQGGAGDNHVTLYVRDNGIGIDPRYHEQIFRVFRRLHRREDYEGTGAGLAIAKKIIEAHGGRLWVESKPNEGATFYFTLPRSAEPVRAALPISA